MPAPKDPEKYKLYIQRLKDSHKGEKAYWYGKTLPDHVKEALRKSHIGKPAHNKGVPMPEAQKEILRKSHLGKKLTEEHKRKISEGVKGRKQSDITKKKISDSHKGLKQPDNVKKRLSEIVKSKWEEPGWREYQSNLHIGKMCGKNHPQWKGGTSFFPYCYKFNKYRRISCRNYYNNICICCGKHVTENIVKGKQYELSVHHTYHDKNEGCNGLPFNLVVLCHACHSKELRHEKEYRDYINKTLREGFKWGIWNEQEYIEKVMYPE